MIVEEIIGLNVYKNIHFEINFNSKILNGIVFIYPSWSVDRRYLNILLDCYKKSNSTHVVYIFDIDNESCRNFEKEFNVLSQGKGEIYLINNGIINYRIENHNGNHPEKEIENLLKSG